MEDEGSAAGFGDNNPFAKLPMFADLAKALTGQGPLNWEAARQFAALSATGGDTALSEGNVDPALRIALGDLARIVELHVHDLSGLDTVFPEVTPVTRSLWAQRTLDAYRPLFTELATSLGRRPLPSELNDDEPDPLMAMMTNLSQMMAPSMMGMAVGSMVGRMAGRTFGQYDLPIPRTDRALLLVPSNIDQFSSDWSLPVDEMRLWVLAQEMIGYTLFSFERLCDQLSALVRQHVGGFRPDASAVAEHISSLDSGDGDPMAAMQQLFSDPALLLGAVQSPEQLALAPQLDAAVSAVVGSIDYLVDAVAARVVGGDALRSAEAVRRRRFEASADDLFVQRLLGLQLTQEQVQRGKIFTAGVVDRVGEHGLVKFFAGEKPLPTPAELAAPGLWIARLEL